MRFWYALALGIFMAALCIVANGFAFALPLIGLIVGFVLEVRHNPTGKIILWGSALSIGLLIMCFIIVASTIQC